MNASDAFSYACSGSLTENEINSYANYVRGNFDRIKQLGGWLGDQVERTMSRFDDFVNSRAWELSKRFTGNGYGEYVGRYDVGYLSSMDAQQNAQGFMRDYIMANPDVMRLFESEDISGYGGDFSKQCRGIGFTNPYYRKAMEGVVDLQTVDDKPLAKRRQYHENVSNGLPTRSVVEIQKTWYATRHHLAKNMFDPTSSDNEKMKTYVEPKEE